MADFKGDRNSISVGLGFRTGGFYLDAAYVYSDQNSRWYAYSSFPSADDGYRLANNALSGPSGSIKTNHNNLVISAGFKF